MSEHLGKIKIQRLGIERHIFREIYYRILRINWWVFILLVSLAYLGTNLVFACILYFTGDNLANVQPGSFRDIYFFSIQSFSTIGYGSFLPKTTFAHVVVTIESLTSILFNAMVTGLTFAKFSRPVVRVIFSKNIVVTEYEGIPTMMFRLGNGRDSNIVDAQLKVSTLRPSISKEGLAMQRLADIHLVRNYSSFFILTWTAMHRLDEKSPFYGYTQQDFEKNKVQIFVSLIGFDEIYSQTVHTTYRYDARDILFDQKFVDVIQTGDDGRRIIDFSKFHDLLPIES